MLRLILGSVLDGYPQIPDNSVDIAVFSPPYFKGDGWSPDLMASLGTLLVRVLKPGARAWMVFGPIQEGLLRPSRSAVILADAAKGGLEEGQTFVWEKAWRVKNERGEEVLSGQHSPINSTRLVTYLHEFVFQFIRKPASEALDLDRYAPGLTVAYADKTNLTRGTRGKRGDVKCGGDVWRVAYETTGHKKKKDHPHEFPEEIARRCLAISAVKPGMVAFDPFIGGGTTAVAAHKLGLDCIGGDANIKALQTTAARLKSLKCPVKVLRV